MDGITYESVIESQGYFVTEGVGDTIKSGIKKFIDFFHKLYLSFVNFFKNVWRKIRGSYVKKVVKQTEKILEHDKYDLWEKFSRYEYYVLAMSMTKKWDKLPTDSNSVPDYYKPEKLAQPIANIDTAFQNLIKKAAEVDRRLRDLVGLEGKVDPNGVSNSDKIQSLRNEASRVGLAMKTIMKIAKEMEIANKEYYSKERREKDIKKKQESKETDQQRDEASRLDRENDENENFETKLRPVKSGSKKKK